MDRAIATSFDSFFYLVKIGGQTVEEFGRQTEKSIDYLCWL
jgi:hypothetical protein